MSDTKPMAWNWNFEADCPQVDAKRSHLEEKKKYYPLEALITALFLSAIALATVIVLSYYNQISLHNEAITRIGFIASASFLFTAGILLSSYVCAKLSTLKSQYGWVDAMKGDALDSTAS